MTVCPQCHTVHGDEHSFCQRCGNPLVGEEKAPVNSCPNCSGPVFPGQNFCTECGQRVKNISGARPSTRPAVRDDLFYKSSPAGAVHAPVLPDQAFLNGSLACGVDNFGGSGITFGPRRLSASHWSFHRDYRPLPPRPPNELTRCNGMWNVWPKKFGPPT